MKDITQNPLSEALGAVSANEAMLSVIVEHFPLPIQIYAPDGTLLVINDACVNLMRLQRDQVVGKFNVLKDPVIDSWGDGVRAQIARSFEGHMVRFEDLHLPAQKIVDRFKTDELCLDSRFMNISCFPIFGADASLQYVVHVFATSGAYDGKNAIVQAKEYIESHWAEDFDLEETARSVHLSRHYFSRLFKRYTSMTPLGYYQEVKIKKLKELLRDENRTIGEAFLACGIAYNGSYAQLFKEKTGMTPSQYRKSIKNK